MNWEILSAQSKFYRTATEPRYLQEWIPYNGGCGFIPSSVLHMPAWFLHSLEKPSFPQNGDSADNKRCLCPVLVKKFLLYSLHSPLISLCQTFSICSALALSNLRT